MRALISVSNKDGIVELAKELEKLGVEIISTGGTYKALKDNKVNVIEICEYTSFKEILDGRVKTLNPIIHGGILAIRNNLKHQEEVKSLNINYIDIVICNLYPFKEVIKKDNATFQEAIENIDIGGPTMLRSAAKNYQDVYVVCDPEDYTAFLDEVKNPKGIDFKLYLMRKVFEHTSSYDALIASYLNRKSEVFFPKELTLTYEKVCDLRYGENPHQDAAFYKEVICTKGSLAESVKLHGKKLSFNNINDCNGALELLKEFNSPTAVCVKHTNPCAVATASNITDAFKKAFDADRVSIFGGIICLNDTLTVEIATIISTIFIEVVIAPKFEEDALDILKQKENIRLLEIKDISFKQDPKVLDLKKVNGGLIVQTQDTVSSYNLNYVTNKKPTEKEIDDLIFAMKVCKHTKSNAIVLAKNQTTIGIAPGQVNRIWSTIQSVEHAKELSGDINITDGAVLASDAFFPFNDCVSYAIKNGIKAIIQPGGSIKDQDSIDKCNEHNISMVTTNIRHFKH